MKSSSFFYGNYHTHLLNDGLQCTLLYYSSLCEWCGLSHRATKNYKFVHCVHRICGVHCKPVIGCFTLVTALCISSQIMQQTHSENQVLHPSPVVELLVGSSKLRSQVDLHEHSATQVCA